MVSLSHLTIWSYAGESAVMDNELTHSLTKSPISSTNIPMRRGFTLVFCQSKWTSRLKVPLFLSTQTKVWTLPIPVFGLLDVQMEPSLSKMVVF